MSQADKYEPGDEPTETKGRERTGVSATGSNAGPNLRPAPAKQDAAMGTTSGRAPPDDIGDAPSGGKPNRGSRDVADT